MTTKIVYIDRSGRYRARVTGYSIDGKPTAGTARMSAENAKAFGIDKPLKVEGILMTEDFVSKENRREVVATEFSTIELPEAGHVLRTGEAAPPTKFKRVPVLSLLVTFNKPGNETAVENVQHVSQLDGKAGWAFAE